MLDPDLQSTDLILCDRLEQQTALTNQSLRYTRLSSRKAGR